MSETTRPPGVTIVAYFVIVVSSLMGIAYVTALPRPGALFGVVESAAKIGLAIGMLKRENWARILFLAFWFLAALGVDLVIYQSQLRDTAFLIPRAIIVVFGVIYVVILTRPDVRRWFGEEAADATEEQIRRRNGRLLATSGSLLVAVSAVLLLFFAWHVYLDVMTVTTWKKTDATIIASEIKGNVVRQVPQSMNIPGSTTGQQRRVGERGTATQIVTYDPEIRYRYRVQGKEYESANFATMKSTLSAVAHPDRLRTLYTPGSVRECWYSPSDPSHAVLQRGISPYYGFSLVALLLLFVGRGLYGEGRRES